MRRPPLTKHRVEGLQALADRVEHLLQEQASDIFPLTPQEIDRARKAVRYVRELSAWSQSREGQTSSSDTGKPPAT